MSHRTEAGDAPDDPELDPALEDPRLTPEHSEMEEAAWRKVIRAKQLTLGLVIALLVVNIIGGVVFFSRVGDSIEKGTETVEAIRETQQKGSPILLQLTALAKQIKSCTDPEGKCAKRGQKATAEAIAGIIAGNSEATKRIVSAALSCQADGWTEFPDLLRCTVETSKED